MINLSTTAVGMAGGAAAVAGVGKAYRFTFGGTWATADEFTVTLTDSLTALSVTLGSGTVTGLVPTFVFAYNDKVYVLAGTAFYFCDLESPLVWNDPQGFGNGFIEVSNNFGTPEDLVALAPYQGRMAAIGRRTTQIWAVDPDPNNYQKTQTLPNVGTVAKLSVAAVGDMDVYLLADNGIRSIRVRDASNNALVADIGTPIDSIIQAVLDTLTDAEKATACAVVEPSSNRYWLYVTGHSGAEGKIYVFSYFPSSGVAAWGTYRATHNVLTSQGGSQVSASYIFTGLTVGQLYRWNKGTQATALTCGSKVLTSSGYFTALATTATVALTTAVAPADVGDLSLVTRTTFAPETFAVYNGRVYCRAGDDVFIYGGTDNQTYDNCGVQWDSPFLNAKTPATRKSFSGVDAACEGVWRLKLGSKPSDAADLTLIYDGTDSSFERGLSLAGKQGTHFKFRGEENSGGYARFSGAIVHFEGGDEK